MRSRNLHKMLICLFHEVCNTSSRGIKALHNESFPQDHTQTARVIGVAS